MIWNRDAETAPRAAPARAPGRAAARHRGPRAGAGALLQGRLRGGRRAATALDARAARRAAVHAQGAPPRPLPVRPLRGAARASVVRIHASSGTRGKPTVVGYTRGDLALWREVMARVARRRRRRARAAASRSPTATACSPAASASTTGPSTWGSPWCRSPPATPCARSCSSRISGRRAGLHARRSRCTSARACASRGSTRARSGSRYGLFGAEPWTEAMRGAARGALGLRGGRLLRAQRDHRPRASRPSASRRATACT